MNLRPVKCSVWRGGNTLQTVKGKFHTFVASATENKVFAMVELDDGQIIKIQSENIRFLDGENNASS